MEGKMTENLIDAMLNGYPEKYIKSNMIIFDSIVFQETGNEGVEIKLCNEGTPLVIYHQLKYKSGNAISFNIIKGLMKVELH